VRIAAWRRRFGPWIIGGAGACGSDVGSGFLSPCLPRGAAGPTFAFGGGGDRTLGAEERRPIERGLRELTGRLGTLRRAKGRRPVGEVVRTGFFDEKGASQRPGMTERSSTGDLRRPSALLPVTPTVSEDDGARLPATWT
jgi:hypothetical protein